MEPQVSNRQYSPAGIRELAKVKSNLDGIDAER